jgi:hypothetical protein
MTSLSLLVRILEQPELVSAVRELPPPILSKLVDHIGLEDAGEIVALATSEQLERVFDDDLWKAVRAGDDETFRPDRFAMWLDVMAEAGEAHLVRRLLELPQDLLALVVHRLVLVVDSNDLAEALTTPTYDAQELDRMLENMPCEEWEELRLIARDPGTWDSVWSALSSLDRDHHDFLRAIFDQCCAMTTEYINGNGGLYEVLTSSELLENDVGAAREDRRATRGFVSPADARAFLELARRGDATDSRDPITHAYFRNLVPTAIAVATGAPSPALGRLVEMIGEPKPPALPSGSESCTRFEAAMRALREHDPDAFATRVAELGYLVNVMMAGSKRALRPVDALAHVVRACDAGLGASDDLAHTPLDQVFRRGFGGCVIMKRDARRARGGESDVRGLPRARRRSRAQSSVRRRSRQGDVRSRSDPRRTARHDGQARRAAAVRRVSQADEARGRRVQRRGRRRGMAS